MDPDKHPLKPGDTYPIDSNKPGDNTPIIYVKTDQHINIKYIDNATNETLKTDTLTGKPGEASDYSTSAAILAFEKQGYELVVDGYPKDGVKFSTDDQDQNYTVTLKHVHHKVTPDNPGVPGQPVDPQKEPVHVEPAKTVLPSTGKEAKDDAATKAMVGLVLVSLTAMIAMKEKRH
ncbi:Cell division protein DamX [Fructobacillus fructosus]|nr:Cell division protein DamX [Fructobacillus fructosus]